MSRPAQQMNPEAQAQLQAQINQARAINGMKVGLEFLIDDSVIGPIKYAEGLADLKWILRGLLSGQFGLNLDAERGLSAVTSKPLSDYEETPGDSGANGEGE